MLIAEGHCFLLRNLKKVIYAKSKLNFAMQRPNLIIKRSFCQQIRNANLKATPTQNNSNHIQTSLAAKISALRVPRNIRTRGVTNAEHDPVVEKTVRIAVILREICEELNNFKGMRPRFHFQSNTLMVFPQIIVFFTFPPI